MPATAFASPVTRTALPSSARCTFSGAAVCARQAPARQNAAPAKWTMAKKAKFGIFSPIVILSSLILGQKNLNKIRGKGISLHSQVITSFCEFTGAGPKTRQSLIRTAKDNGNTLGFLS